MGGVLDEHRPWRLTWGRAVLARLARALTAAVAATALVTTGLTTTASAVAPPPAAAEAGPFTTVATTTTGSTGKYVFYTPFSKTAWYRASFAGNASAAAAVSRTLKVVLGPLPTRTLFWASDVHGTGLTPMNGVIQGGWDFAGDTAVLRVFGGTRFKVFDTTNRLVLLDVALTPNTHVQATRLFAVQGWHDLLVQTYCPGQISVRTV